LLTSLAYIKDLHSFKQFHFSDNGALVVTTPMADKGALPSPFSPHLRFTHRGEIHLISLNAMTDDRLNRPIKSADFMGDKFSNRTLITPRKSAAFVGRFYRSSVIGFRLSKHCFCCFLSPIIQKMFYRKCYFKA